MSTQPSRDDAEAALGEIEAARRAVTAESERSLPIMLAAWSSLVAVDYAAKDHMPSRTAQRGVSVLCAAATLGIGLLDIRSQQVQPVSVDPNDLDTRAAAPMMASLAVWAVAERLVIRGLRKSRLRYPNTAVGAILAITRPAAFVLVMRLTPKPSVT